MNTRSLALGVLAATALCSSASASMTGVCAFVSRVNGYTLVDLFATMSEPLDQLQVISLSALRTDAAGGFVQGSTPGLKGWAPDVNFTSKMASLDSFVTVGGSTYGDPSGPYIANNSLMQAGFGSNSWTGTPFSPPANSIVEAEPGGRLFWRGEYDDAKTRAISLAGFAGRIDVQGNAATSSYGAWFAHLVVAGDGPFSITMSNWNAQWNWNLQQFSSASYVRIGDPELNTTFIVPAPSAAVVLAMAGMRRRRRP